MDSFVTHHLKGVSRTYALLIPMLPSGFSDAVGLAYLLMRIVDTIEDAPTMPDDLRRICLRELDAILIRGDSTSPPSLPPQLGELAAERELMTQTPDVLRRIAALDPQYAAAARTCARQMIAGVQEMMDRAAARNMPYPAIQDAAEMRRYCYYVAGVVGEMLCEMMAHLLRQPGLLKLRELAVELGIGLQLVNILKDALKDSKHGRRYLPCTIEGQVAQREVYRMALAEARKSLQVGTEFVLALPATAWQLRSFCGLPIAWGAMTLARAEKDESAAKVGRSAIMASIERFTSLARDDDGLRKWLVGLITPQSAPSTA